MTSLFEETIWDEVAFASRMQEYPEEKVKKLTDEALQIFGLEKYKKRYIFSLDEDLKDIPCHYQCPAARSKNLINR